MLHLCTWTYLSSFHIFKHLFLLVCEYCVTVFLFVCLFQNVLIVEVSWVLMSYCTSIKSHSQVMIVCSFSNCVFASLAGRWWRGRGVDLLNDLSVFLQLHDGSNYIAATLIGTLPCNTQESLFLHHWICSFYGFINSHFQSCFAPWRTMNQMKSLIILHACSAQWSHLQSRVTSQVLET